MSKERILTPDLIIGTPKNKIPKKLSNINNFFYVDVKEVTGAMFKNFKVNNPYFPTGNPVKNLIENLEKSPQGKIERILINENDSMIIDAIFQPVKKTIEKYGVKRKSDKVGIIFVESPNFDFSQNIHFLKIIEILFKSIEIQLSGKDLNYVQNLKYEILANQKRCFIPITVFFKFFNNINNWAFLMIMGSKAYEGLSICFINQQFLNKHLPSNDKVIKWINKLSKMYNYSYI